MQKKETEEIQIFFAECIYIFEILKIHYLIKKPHKLLWTVHAVSHQRQLLQQHVHHGSILVLLEGLGLLRHLLCLGATLGLHCKRLGLTFNLKGDERTAVLYHKGPITSEILTRKLVGIKSLT